MTRKKRLARRRGHDLERQVARDLTAIGVPAQRNFEFREGSVDVLAPGWSIQCKNQARPNVWTALKEAEDATKIDTLVDMYQREIKPAALAVVRRSKPGKTIAVMDWKDFLKFIETKSRKARKR